MTAVTQKQSEVRHLQKVLFTLGYEGQTADEVFHRLEAAGVRILMDVRYRPQSRKSGLSKSNLAQTCAERGMIYVHDRDLGTPPEMMDHVKVKRSPFRAESVSDSRSAGSHRLPAV